MTRFLFRLLDWWDRRHYRLEPEVIECIAYSRAMAASSNKVPAGRIG